MILHPHHFSLQHGHIYSRSFFFFTDTKYLYFLPTSSFFRPFPTVFFIPTPSYSPPYFSIDNLFHTSSVLPDGLICIFFSFSIFSFYCPIFTVFVEENVIYTFKITGAAIILIFYIITYNYINILHKIFIAFYFIYSVISMNFLFNHKSY